ncbi:hypothetical protein DM860_006709 [Cuscuta australis]|uniref:Leucine-rich repeat-containing N-terminal plant-type domain-containing protein n=1 Tax=Cuscuta australis TaxID=267555 RepID=A0A328D8M6_9ASTE|nr:hypothetical protein DM860_006709 [Cuscuta australis]
MGRRRMMMMGFYTHALTAWFILLVHSFRVSLAANSEGDALNSFKTNLQDPNRVLQSWDNNLINPCTWFHVTCDDQNRVTRVEVYSNSISGQIPPELGDLTNLISLDLYGNSLTGPIPASLGKLSKLQFLRLNNNSLSGSIPVELTRTWGLNVLDLSNNRLSGIVPVTGSFSGFTPISFGNNPDLCFPTMKHPC